jgi:hypothetical protein
LQPTLFLENWLVFADAIRKESKIFLPYGQGKSASPDAFVAENRAAFGG